MHQRRNSRVTPEPESLSEMELQERQSLHYEEPRGEENDPVLMDKEISENLPEPNNQRPSTPGSLKKESAPHYARLRYPTYEEPQYEKPKF